MLFPTVIAQQIKTISAIGGKVPLAGLRVTNYGVGGGGSTEHLITTVNITVRVILQRLAVGKIMFVEIIWCNRPGHVLCF